MIIIGPTPRFIAIPIKGTKINNCVIKAIDIIKKDNLHIPILCMASLDLFKDSFIVIFLSNRKKILNDHTTAR